MTNGHLADLPWRRDVRRFHPDALPGLFSRSVGWSMMNVVAAMQLKDFIVGSGLGVNWRRSRNLPASALRRRETQD